MDASTRYLWIRFTWVWFLAGSQIRLLRLLLDQTGIAVTTSGELYVCGYSGTDNYLFAPRFASKLDPATGAVLSTGPTGNDVVDCESWHAFVENPSWTYYALNPSSGAVTARNGSTFSLPVPPPYEAQVCTSDDKGNFICLLSLPGTTTSWAGDTFTAAGTGRHLALVKFGPDLKPFRPS